MKYEYCQNVAVWGIAMYRTTFAKISWTWGCCYTTYSQGADRKCRAKTLSPNFINKSCNFVRQLHHLIRLAVGRGVEGTIVIRVRDSFPVLRATDTYIIQTDWWEAHMTQLIKQSTLVSLTLFDTVNIFSFGATKEENIDLSGMQCNNFCY
jgi:hypothetical protein